MLVGLLSTLLGAVTFTQLDRRLTASGYLKPYYAVHVLHNAMIVALTAGDVWTALTDVDSIFARGVTWPAVYLCYALHFYHLYEYWRVFHMDDWLHHVLMIGVALPLGSATRSGALMGMTLFFTTGLPGGINYALLFAERNGWVSRETEKAINVPVHQWLRGPGCVATATQIFAMTQSATGATIWDRVAATLITALTFWNGIYFTNQVVRADERRRLSRPEDAGAGVSNTGRTQATTGAAPQ
jgi:hypothetical protein